MTEVRRVTRRLSKQAASDEVVKCEEDATDQLQTPRLRRSSKRRSVDAELLENSVGRETKRRRGEKRKRLSISKFDLTADGLPLTSLLCQFCTGDDDENRKGEAEKLLRCSVCLESAHPSCLSMSEGLADMARRYEWQCFSCKSCQRCHSSAQTKKMLMCDSCDRGYHMFCLEPPLEDLPEGEWNCPLCASRVCGETADVDVETVDASSKLPSPVPTKEEDEEDEPEKPVDILSPPAEERKEGKRRRSTIIVRRRKSTSRKERSASQQDELKVDKKPEGKIGEKAKLRTLSAEHLDALKAQLSGSVSDEELSYFLTAYSAAQDQTAQEQRDLVGSKEPEDLVSMRRTLRSVSINKSEIETRFSSPYPDEFASLDRLFLCSFCLLPTSSPLMLRRHMAKCRARHPPGSEIYRKDRLAVFEVDGAKHKDYCQRLCLLAKLFLHHKTLYHQVEPFLFYVLTTIEKSGCQLVGYFQQREGVREVI